MYVQLALSTQDEQMDNTIIDGFETVEKQVKGYSESNLDSTILGASSKEHEFKNLRGKKINEKQALEQGQALFNVKKKDRKSTRLNSSHVAISYAVLCLKNNKIK